MKAIFVINSLGGGGAEKQLLLTATMLARAGHGCAIVTLRGIEPHPRMVPFIAEARAAGVEWCEPAQRKQFLWSEVWRLRRLLRAQPDALLWTWGYRADVVRLLLGALGCRPRTLVALRSADGPRLARYRWYWRLLRACTDLFVSNSRLNLDQLEAVAPGAWARGAVIYNALDQQTLARPAIELPVARPPSLHIHLLGNLLIQIKGYDLLIPLARAIQARGWPWKLHVGGAPFEGPKLQAMIDEAGVSDVVRLEGLIEQPLDFLGAGHVYLMLSRVEGMPNALLEAMSLGLPAVCTRVGDVPHFARDREHLRLVNVGDVPGTLAALEAIWEDWPEAVAMGRRGRARCRELFTPERMAAETLSLLEDFERKTTR